ncbi:spore germination protein [Desulfosporosinus sp. SB140]|uniref:spore germination protein n=1 Tax=Desulfosporosinus paludis TaxID=3115649 RepID=UPI00388DC868
MIKRLSKFHSEYAKSNNGKSPITASTETESALITSNLAANLSELRRLFQGSVDVIFREFNIGFDSKNRALLIYINGLTDPSMTNYTILQPLMVDLAPRLPQDSVQGNLLSLIRDYALPNGNVQESNQIQDIVGGILAGCTALLLDGFNVALLIETKGGAARDVTEPDTEAVIRGPREGFTETIGVNISLLRRKIKDENLCIEKLSLGKRTKTLIYITYLKGVVHEELVGEVKARLQRIDIEGILESGYVEQLIEDAPFSIFPTVGNSEKPDVLAAKLLEGRVGILVDGTPFVLTVPRLLVESFQNAEDYYTRPYYSTLVRWLRILAFFITILLPAIYVGVESYHQELLPTPLLLNMAASKEGVPFPAFVEVLIMGTIFEIMREAGVRMPRPVGQAVSIVGALVLGEAAVRAGVVSNPMVIVVALTAISGFVIAPLGDALPLLRVFFSLCSAGLGLFGILMGMFVVFIHLAKLRSFGVPYMAPLAPGNREGLKDVSIKAPIWSLNTRPNLLTWNSLRQRVSKPSPGKKRG